MWTPWGWTVHLIPKFLRALNASWGNFGHGEWLLTLQNQRCLPMPSTQPGEPHIQPPAPARSCPISEGAQAPLGTSWDLCKPQIFLWGAFLQASPSPAPSPKPEGVRSFAQFGQGGEVLTPIPSKATTFPFGDPKCVSEAPGQIQGDVCPADPASNGPTGFIFIVGAAGRQNGAPGPSTSSYFIFNCFQSPRSDDPDGAQWP